MELQWLAALTPTQLSSDPELFVQKRFLGQSGALAPYKLDARKLVTVEYASSQGDLAVRLVQAAIQVEGLYAISARLGPHQVFISRNENLVRAAAGITEIHNAKLLNLAQEKAEADEHHKRLLELVNIPPMPSIATPSCSNRTPTPLLPSGGTPWTRPPSTA